MSSISKLKMENRSNGKAVTADDDICVVCFKTVEVYSIGECDHPVCYECSTRMRVLCQQNECPICRQVLSKVIFINEKSPYRELEIQNRSEYYNRKYKIGFHTFEIQQKFSKLLDHPCPKCNTLPYRTFEGLRNHVRKEHNMFYCDLCVDHLKIFTFERRCYTPNELNLHRNKGDPDNRSHRGHPLCEYCKKRYLDRDELFRHLRREHYYCHFCDADGSNQFYNDYNALADHFRRDHYLCEEGKCATEQFIGAFRTEIDYKAHVANFHGKNMNKQQAKQTRTLQLEITLGPRGRPTQTEQNLNNIRTQSSTEIEQDVTQSSQSHSDAQQQQHQLPNINPNSEQEFPSLAGATNTTNVTLTRPPPQPLLQIHRTSGLARTKENFPALGGGNHPATTATAASTSNDANNSPTSSRNQQITTPISSIVRNILPAKTGAIHRTITSTNTTNTTAAAAASTAAVVAANANSNGLILHVNNRPTSKKNNISDYPALPNITKTKKTTVVATTTTVAVTTSAVVTAPPTIATTIATVTTASKPSRTSKSALLEDMLIPSETSLPLEAISPKHRSIVDDYVSVAKPSNFQKIQMIQKNNENTSKLLKQTEQKSPPKLTNQDFPTLAGSSPTLHPTASSVWIKVKSNDRKQKENDLRKTSKAVAPAPILPKTSNNNAAIKIAKNTTKNNNNNNLNNNNNNNNNNNVKNPEVNNNTKEKKVNEKKPKEYNGNISNKNQEKNISNQAINHSAAFNSNKNEKSKSPIQTKVTLNSIAISPNNLTFTNSLGKSFSILPTYNYIPPPDALHRNQKLVTYFKDTLNSQEALLEFRHISQKFRDGFYKTQPYYEHCQAALKHKFHKVFPELLVLLPDISKQQELYLAHQQHVNTMKSEERKALPKLHVCSKCKQVLVDCDAEAHYKMHDFQKDFPQLQRATTAKFPSST